MNVSLTAMRLQAPHLEFEYLRVRHSDHHHIPKMDAVQALRTQLGSLYYQVIKPREGMHDPLVDGRV